MARWVRLILMFVVMALLAWYVWRARDEFGRLMSQVDRGTIFLLLGPMLAVPLFSLLVNSTIARFLTAELGVKLGGVEAFCLATVNSLGNCLPMPQAGAMARGVYLKKVHGLAYTTYAATVIVAYVSSLALTGAAGLAGLAWLAATGRPAPWQLWVAFAGLSCSAVLFTPLGGRIPLPRKLATFREGLAALRQHHVLRRIAILQSLLIALTATGLFVSARVLPGTQNVTWNVGLMLGLISMIAAVLNVLGIEQAAAMGCAALLAIDPKIGLTASAIFRLTSIGVMCILGPWVTHYLSRRAGQTPSSQDVTASPGAAVELKSPE